MDRKTTSQIEHQHNLLRVVHTERLNLEQRRETELISAVWWWTASGSTAT
jgi:hypothetical protein